MKQLFTFDECKQLSRFIIAMNPNRNGNKGTINSYILDYYKELTRQIETLKKRKLKWQFLPAFS